MGELGVLFNPGMRHEREEKLAKQMIREDEGTGRKGRRSIDLESGVVVIGSDGSSDVDDLPAADEPDVSAAEQRAVAGRVASDDEERAAARSGAARAKRVRSGAKPTGKAHRRKNAHRN